MGRGRATDSDNIRNKTKVEKQHTFKGGLICRLFFSGRTTFSGYKFAQKVGRLFSGLLTSDNFQVLVFVSDIPQSGKNGPRLLVVFVRLDSFNIFLTCLQIRLLSVLSTPPFAPLGDKVSPLPRKSCEVRDHTGPRLRPHPTPSCP